MWRGNGDIRRVGRLGADAAHRLRGCVRRWQLQPVGRLDGGFRSEVFGCRAADGAEVVVKLVILPEEARAEAAALIAWAHTGAAVRLIDADFERNALLLERIRPGTHLSGIEEPAATETAATVLSRLHHARPGPFAFPDLLETYVRMEHRAYADAEWEQRSRKDPARGRAGLMRLPAARGTALRLCASTSRTVLLHGDFLDKNLLCGGPGYVAIDPIPSIGDPCADAGFFAAGRPPAAMILDRAGTIAGLMGVDPHRARQWAAVWGVLQACQGWRDDQLELEAYLSHSEFEHLIHE